MKVSFAQGVRRALCAGAMVQVMTGFAFAQSTELNLSQSVVTPGALVSATVVGPPGHYFAVLGSTVGAGLTFAGQDLAIGIEYAVVASGQLDGAGLAVVSGVPPFLFTTLDRYYLQAVTSESPTFVPAALSPGRVLRNADLVVGISGPMGPIGPTGAIGPAGPIGATGPAGATGATGATGPTGATGLTGPQGPVGPAGTQALFGTNTNTAAPGNGVECTLGAILLTAGSVANGTPASGQLLSISQNQALFSLLGITFGGNGVTTFALPDLRAAAPNGHTYSICTVGVFPSGQ